MRIFFCVLPALVLAFIIGIVGAPTIVCIMVSFVMFGFGWQVTNPNNETLYFRKIIKNKEKHEA